MSVSGRNWGQPADGCMYRRPPTGLINQMRKVSGTYVERSLNSTEYEGDNVQADKLRYFLAIGAPERSRLLGTIVEATRYLLEEEMVCRG